MSSNEGTLLRWLELNYEAHKNEALRLTNFDEDLKSGLVLECVIRNYAGRFGSIKTILSGLN